MKLQNVPNSDSEWKERLSDQSYEVMKNHGTERPFSSQADKEKRDGMFYCAACGNPLFDSNTKFDSKTGWPSFYDIQEGNVETKKDFKLIIPRTEVHCSRCKGHLGHVFKDGPNPTGKRYCINGAALEFEAKE